MSTKVGRPEVECSGVEGGGGGNKAFPAWKILVTRSTYILTLRQIIAAGGSPCGGWPIFRKIYAPQTAAENIGGA